MREAEVSPCIVIGHTFSIRGAFSQDGTVSEYQYNSKLAKLIADCLHDAGMSPNIIDKSGHDKAGIVDLINSLAPSCCIELHCNSASCNAAQGTECLVLPDNPRSHVLAGWLLKSVYACLNRQGHELRGVKVLGPSDRGYFNLKGIQCPALISEPFFINNPKDFRLGMDKLPDLAGSVAQGIIDFLKSEPKAP
jgi:N-acetylmuramoyl-L-alanine amidase